MKRAGTNPKLLIYAEYFLPVIGGVQTALALLARGLAERAIADPSSDQSMEVTLVTRSAGDGMDDSAMPYRIIRRPSLRQLTRLVREADVIHIAGPCFVPLVLVWLLGKPAAVEHHGYQAACPNGLLLIECDRSLCPGHFMAGRYRKCVDCNSGSIGWLKSLRLLLMTFPRRWLCRRVSRNITITNHVAVRLDLPRSTTIYYGIEILEPRLPGSHRQPSQKLRLAYLGRLVPEKGVPVLLRAAERLAKDGCNFELTLIGDGPERSSLEALTESLGLSGRVTFAGELQRQRVDEELRTTDVVVMPSLWEETAGLAAMEQMMTGGVVVASEIGGLAEVVDGAGLKFSAGDAEELYSRLSRIANHPSELVQLGSLARTRALSQFSLDRFISEHNSLYRELLNKRK
ncbi:MAG: glycosyltransferase family 4 protein [Candidatus Acidiferrales bacterium]